MIWIVSRISISDYKLDNLVFFLCSPCALGMLWNVTNTDTDYMALTLLNHWLPGKPIDLKSIVRFNGATFFYCLGRILNK